jgi:AcrR family transcriptional regulator
MSVFGSFINHRIPLPRRGFERLLHRLATTVVDFPMARRRADSRAAPLPSADRLALPRREQLLTSAIKLIDERGFQSVNMTDIGAAVGISGPSIYKHYPAKTDLLVAALVRGHDRLQGGMTRALARARDPGEALDLLLRAEIDFALEERSLVGILISERDQLPDKDRQRVNRAQRDILDTWVRVLDNAHPGLAPAEARITINVVFAVINNLVRTPRLAARPDLPEQLVALCTALLTVR